MATSTVPALKAALLARLTARAGLAGVQITYGKPHSSLEDEWIMLGDTSAGDPTGEERAGQSSKVIGRRSREERYLLDVWVSVIGSGLEEQQVVTERAYELVAEIEDELGDDPTVNGIVRTAQVADASELTEAIAKNGQHREAQVRVRVACAERI